MFPWCSTEWENQIKHSKNKKFTFLEVTDERRPKDVHNDLIKMISFRHNLDRVKKHTRDETGDLFNISEQSEGLSTKNQGPFGRVSPNKLLRCTRFWKSS